MGLFSKALANQINQIAAKSNEEAAQSQPINVRSINDDLNEISKQVEEYFKDSPAILIENAQQLHNYITKCIENGYAGIDTETTGLDRINDHVVGASLYTLGLPECYIPMKHIVPLFDNPYKNQLSYEEVGQEFARLVDGEVKLIFANADFDLAMIYKDLKVDLIPAFYYDVIIAWRCLREDENDNSLKGLYAKYVKKGKIDPKKFSDFFPVKLFPYCKPKIAALYAANDAKITYELFMWQLPYVTKSHEKCQKHHLEKIADLVWNLEFPLVAVCAHLHRRGVFLDDSIAAPLHERYTSALHKDEAELAKLVQELIDTKDIASNRNRPFRSGADFNPNSNPHVKYLINNLLGSSAKTTSKDVLKEINKPATKAVLKVRGDVKLLSTYVDKLPKAVGPDHRIHATFKSIGAATGRMCIAAGSYVNTTIGHKKIEDIKPGDEVACYDIEHRVAIFSEVINTWKTGENKKCVKLYFGDNTLVCTPEHPVLVNNKEWILASEIEIGSVLTWLNTDENHDPMSVENITLDAREELEERFDVYDIEVEGYHNFFVTNVCVHNSSDSPNAQNIPSKSHDIRHMFRATPEINELIHLKAVGNQISFTLSRYDSVQTIDNTYIKVKDLTTVSIVSCTCKNQRIDFSVSDLKFIDGSCNAMITLSNKDDAEASEDLTLAVNHPPYVIMSSDYSQQEPRLTATVSSDQTLINAFRNNKDVYATISSIALGFPYEECLEFNPVTGELQPEGKERRSAGKVLNLGITYGMSVQSISESLFATRDDMTDEQKLKEAQKIQDSLMKGFPGVARAIADAQRKATELGYTETILGRRRHHPNMQLPKFEFVPMDGYANPDIDPLDPKSLENKEQIPKRLVDALTKEFNSYKWYGKIVKRTKELAEQKIKVINNSYKIEEASRQCFNSVIQGSAADLTKMAMLRLEHDKQWAELGGRFVIPVHDELICEVPLENVKEGAETLARCMCEAGSFLPFKLSCDCEASFRWYGLATDDIFSKEKPISLDWDSLSESNIEWLQCMIVENEYLLPILPEPDGSKPQGIRASGVNGVITDELKEAVQSYMNRYQLKSDQEFLDHIEAKVIRGVY